MMGFCKDSLFIRSRTEDVAVSLLAGLFADLFSMIWQYLSNIEASRLIDATQLVHSRACADWQCFSLFVGRLVTCGVAPFVSCRGISCRMIFCFYGFGVGLLFWFIVLAWCPSPTLPVEFPGTTALRQTMSCERGTSPLLGGGHFPQLREDKASCGSDCASCTPNTKAPDTPWEPPICFASQRGEPRGWGS